jgi:hypothetical protein
VAQHELEKELTHLDNARRQLDEARAAKHALENDLMAQVVGFGDGVEGWGVEV